MLGFLQNTSSEIAVAGAQSNLDKAVLFIECNPSSQSDVLILSYEAIRWRLSDEFGIVLNEYTALYMFHTYEFHRVAHDLKRKSKHYAKNTEEWAASLIVVAAFSILGATPSAENRNKQWQRLIDLWFPIMYQPENENEIITYDARAQQLWVRG